MAPFCFGEGLRFNPQAPKWPNRDRFILSAGHGSMFLYGWLHISGFDLPIEEVKNFRQHHSATPGHPEFGETPGVEATTGTARPRCWERRRLRDVCENGSSSIQYG